MKSGFVAILGRPNVGKSTLLNNLLKRKVSIVSNKSQTTRNNIKAIYNTDDVQIVFIDTPGIHKPRLKLDENMNTMAYRSAHDVDVTIIVVDASEKFGNGDNFILEHLDIKKDALIIVLNKIDLATLPHVQQLKSEYQRRLPNAKIIETVGTEGFNVDEVLKETINLLPEGPKYFEDDDSTDQDVIFQIKEIIREKALRVLRDEVPHAIAIYVEHIDWDNDPIHIQASIIVEKESQKGIVIGARGSKIKLIGTRSRADIEQLLKKHVFLELYVKVQEDWRNQEKFINDYGYKVQDK